MFNYKLPVMNLLGRKIYHIEDIDKAFLRCEIANAGIKKA